MKSFSKGFAIAICLSVFCSGLANAADLSAAGPADGSMIVAPEWTADLATYPPISPDNVKGLTQLVQIGKGEPLGAAWSPDGEKIALACGTGVHLFDGHTLQPLGVLESGYARIVVWSQDSSLLALCTAVSAGDEIQVWDAAAMEKKYGITQKRSISKLLIDQESNSLFALGNQQTGKTSFNSPLYKAFLDTYSLKSGKKKEDSVSFESKEKGLMELGLSAKGTVVFGAGMSEMYLWKASGKLIYSAPLTYPLYALSASGADVSVLLDLSSREKLQIIDRASKTKIADAALPKSVTRMEVNDETQELMLYTQSGYIVFGLETQEITADVAFAKKYAGTVWISGDKSRLFQLDSGNLKLIDLSSEAQLGEQTGYDDRAWQVAVSGSRLVAAKGSTWSSNTRLLWWDLNTLAPIAQVGAPDVGVMITEMFFLPDESELITGADQENKITFWNAADGAKNRDVALGGNVYSAALSADGAVLAIGLGGGVMNVMPLADTSTVKPFYLDRYISGVSLSADGGRVAACDGTFLIVWDVASQEELLFIMDEDMVALALTADGERVAVLYTGEDGYVVKMKNVDTEKKLWSRTLTEDYKHMCFTPDGGMLAVSAHQDGLTFLNAETGKPVFTLAGDIGDFSISKDGRFLVSASSDGTVRLWGVVPE